MQILRLDSPNSVMAKCLSLLELVHQQERDKVFRGFLPTGSTPDPLYQLMTANHPSFLKNIEILQIDEFCDGNLFRGQLLQKLIAPLKAEKQFTSISGQWTNLEFFDHIYKVTSKPITFSVLGLGPNGHVGFHEPQIGGLEFLGGRVKLEKETATRVPNATSDHAFTFGAGTFSRSQEIFLLATGQSKQKALEKFINERPNKDFPATLLKSHPQLTVITDIRDS